MFRDHRGLRSAYVRVEGGSITMFLPQVKVMLTPIVRLSSPIVPQTPCYMASCPVNINFVLRLDEQNKLFDCQRYCIENVNIRISR